MTLIVPNRYGPPALKLSRATSSAVRDTRTSNCHSVHQLEDRNETKRRLIFTVYKQNIIIQNHVVHICFGINTVIGCTPSTRLNWTITIIPNNCPRWDINVSYLCPETSNIEANIRKRRQTIELNQ